MRRPSPAFDIAWVDEKVRIAKPIQSTGKYAHLIKSLKSGVIIERGKLNPARLTPEQLARLEEMQKKTGFKPGPGNADHLTWMYGKDLGRIECEYSLGILQPARDLAPRR